MRTLFIELETEGLTDEQIAEVVRDLAPWASRWTRTEGGVRAWESITDYDIWIGQV